MKKITMILPIIFLFFGCSNLSSPKAIPGDISMAKGLSLKNEKEKQLIRRLKEYWFYKKNCDLKSSFKYELPSQQYLMKFSQYRSLTSCYAPKATIKEIIYLHPDIAIVKKEIERKDGKKFIGKEKWYYIKGLWYHKFYQNLFPPSTYEDAKYQ